MLPAEAASPMTVLYTATAMEARSVRTSLNSPASKRRARHDGCSCAMTTSIILHPPSMHQGPPFANCPGGRKVPARANGVPVR